MKSFLMGIVLTASSAVALAAEQLECVSNTVVMDRCFLKYDHLVLDLENHQVVSHYRSSQYNPEHTPCGWPEFYVYKPAGEIGVMSAENPNEYKFGKYIGEVFETYATGTFSSDSTIMVRFEDKRTPVQKFNCEYKKIKEF